MTLKDGDYDKFALRIELDLLLLFYTFSDQYGNVDVNKCQQWAKNVMGIYLPATPFKFTQEHVDVLVQCGILPDSMGLINEIKRKSLDAK
jgi:hypothetical protein